MKQCLQSTPFAFSGRMPRQQRGHEMVLIGKPDQLQAGVFRAFRDGGPFNVRGDIDAPHVVQRRRNRVVPRERLQRAGCPLGRVKFCARISVIDRKDKSALQFLGDGLDPIRRRKVDLGLAGGVFVPWNFLQSGVQLRMGDRLPDENEIRIGIRDELFLPFATGVARSRGPASNRSVRWKNGGRRTAPDRRAILSR